MATKSKKNNRYQSQGVSGVNIFNGIITGEEYNANLRGRNALRTWDEMRRSDAAVKLTLKSIKEPIKALPWFIEGASDDPKHVEQRDYINAVMFDILRWKTSLGEILTHLEFGFSVHEKVLDVQPVLGTDRIVLKNLAFRKQTSISKWQAGDDRPGVTQINSKGQSIPIDLERLVVFTNEQEGDNYEGISILRAAYKHWYYKDKLYQIDAIGHERQALGVVKIKHPKNAEEKYINKAEEAARNLRANEEAFITEPEGWEIEFMDMKAQTLRETLPSIDHHDLQIPSSVMAGFMKLGSTSGSGSRSVGEVQYKAFEQQVLSVAEYIADTMNQYVIKELIDLNFNNVTEYPKLTVGALDKDSLKELAESYKTLVDAGAIDPTPEDEAYLRGRLGLPERPDEEEADEDDDEPTKNKETDPGSSTDPVEDLKEEKGKKASIAASVAARDIPGLYDGLGVDPESLGCIMIDTESVAVLEHVAEAEADIYTSDDSHGQGVAGETEAHVTLLYGLLENGNVWKDKVDAVLDGWSLPTIKIDHVGHFELGDKIAIVAHVEATPELIDGHERLTLLPHVQTFSEYKPHLTLAYVKPDQAVADKWVAALDQVLAGAEVKTTGINYGDQPEQDVKASVLSRARAVLASLKEKLYGNKNRAD